MIVQELGQDQAILSQDPEKWSKSDRDSVQESVDELLANADNAQFTTLLKEKADELIESYVPERRERMTTKKVASGKKISLFAKAAE
jgi:hypothetical protein